MREIRQDNFIVGWYLSSTNGNYLNFDTIEHQFHLQSQFINCVCIVYDPTFSKNGRLAIRAFRLTDKFMSFYKNQRKLGAIGPTSIGTFDINSRNIMEEKQIQLHCTHLTHSFLFEIQKNKLLQCDFDRLHDDHGQLYNRSNQVKFSRDKYARQIEMENNNLKSRGLRTKQMPDLEKLSRLESVILNSQMS